jgi:flagellar biosynthetic protein FlhB
MMAEKDEGQEKTEQGTPKRREEAREKGRVAKSREVSSVAILGASLIYFYFNASGLLEKISAIMASIFRSAGRVTIGIDNVQALFAGILFKVFIILLPLFLVIFIIAILSNLIQVGVLFSATSIQPEWSKVDPIKGFERLFSMNSFVEFIKNILKMVIICFVSYLVIRSEVEGCLPLADQTVWEIMTYMGRITFKILLTTCLALVLLAILDYAYQRWEYEKGLRMSRQEIKEEFKNSEGDPAVKARIKRLQREMSRKRMMAAVPKADVVITNPTHLAVAIRYDRHTRVAPYVLAKGAGVIAERIRELARQEHIPIVENKPLAQVLYKVVRIDDMIPEDLYRSVAEVLAFVYNLKKA